MIARLVSDEIPENGLLLSGKYVPREQLAEILCAFDNESLLLCRLVCKTWKILIETYVWRKKAEVILGRSLPFAEKVSWHDYYLICKKKPFERNLIKNHSGKCGLNSDWTTMFNLGTGWSVERPPVKASPVPDEAQSEQYCFVTSHRLCHKFQRIDLLLEGFSPFILDKIRPPIVVSEWYSSRSDCPAIYKLFTQLLGKNNKFLDSYNISVNIEREKQYYWHHVSHTFEGYGPGLREIVFGHSGLATRYWKGPYGCKMAGACVCVKIPTQPKPNRQQPKPTVQFKDTKDCITPNTDD